MRDIRDIGVNGLTIESDEKRRHSRFQPVTPVARCRIRTPGESKKSIVLVYRTKYGTSTPTPPLLTLLLHPALQYQ